MRRRVLGGAAGTTSPGLPPHRPIPPVLARMALGLGLASLGAVVAWQHVVFEPMPGLSGNVTPIQLSQDGLDAATVRLEGDRADLRLGALSGGSPDLLAGSVTHRARNPVTVESARSGGTLGEAGLRGATMTARLTLNVQPLDRSVAVTGAEPFQHRLDVDVARNLPLTLTTLTYSGDQVLDLSALRLRALTTRTTFGTLSVTLPARQSGPLSLVSVSGDISVRAPTGASPEALRVNADGGDLALNLGAARMQTLNVGSASGNVRLTLPRSGRSSVNAGLGDVTITARPGTRGSLDIRTGRGQVTLRVPQALKVRVRFTDRDPLVSPLPAPVVPSSDPALGATLTEPEPPRFVPPALDVFVDAPARAFTLDYTDAPTPPLLDSPPSTAAAPATDPRSADPSSSSSSDSASRSDP